jgi:CHAT domain-containing protein
MAELRFQLGRVEVGADYMARHHRRLQTGARAALERLFQLVIAPLQHLLKHDRLLIVPHGPLHLAPFHALWDGTSHLLETFEITYAASASVAVHRRRRPVQLHSLAGLALHDVAIPQAEAEVRTAARYFDAASLYVDDSASFDGLHRAAASADVLHVATHGLFRADNPFFSALKLADGWLDVRQIYRLPLAARLVVLSACESGAVQVQGSDEPIGLVRGFLGAGAETLVVSLWNVHDATAAQLMERFYAHLTAQENHRTAAALRHAQRAAIAEERHPYFWAPYIVVGE